MKAKLTISLVILFILLCSTFYQIHSLHHNQHQDKDKDEIKTLILDFHYQSYEQPIINLHTLSQIERDIPQLYIIKVNPFKVSLFSTLFQSILVDYIPDSYFLIHTTGTHILEILHNNSNPNEQNDENNNKTTIDDDDIIGIVYYPSNMKVARNTLQYLEYMQYNPLSNSFQQSLTTFENNIITNQKRLNNQQYHFVDNNIQSIAYPTHFTQTIPLLSTTTTSTSTTPTYFNNITTQLYTSLTSFFTTLPTSLTRFRSYYQSIVNDIEQQDNNDINYQQLYDNPQELQSLINQDNPQIDPTVHLVQNDENNNSISPTPTRSFIASFTSHVLDNVYNIQEYGLTFLENNKNVQNMMNKHYQTILTHIRSLLVTTPSSTSSTPNDLTSKPFLTSITNFISTIQQYQFDMTQFISTFESTYQTLSQQQPQQQQGQQQSQHKSNVHLYTEPILPFLSSMQHTKMPESTIESSQIPFNTARIQFQSPYLIQNDTYIAQITAERLSAMNTIMNQFQLDVGFFTGYGDNNNGNNNGDNNNGNNKPNFTFEMLKQLIADQYHYELYDNDNLQPTTHINNILNQAESTTTQSSHESTTSQSSSTQFYSYFNAPSKYDRCRPERFPVRIRTTLHLHIDTIILSFYESYAKQQILSLQQQLQQQNNNILSTTTLIPKLCPMQLSTLVSQFIQFQSNSIHYLIHTTIDQLTTLPNLYTIEYEKQNTLFNNYARFAITVGLDNIAIDQSEPTKMSLYGPYQDAGIRGQNIVISVADTGIDVGHCFFHDNEHSVPFTGLIGKETADTNHRKIRSYLSLADELDIVNGHGSHVAGSVAGGCIYTEEDKKNNFHPSSIQNGALPDGRLAFADIGACGNLSPALDAPIIYAHALSNGATITSNSWGSTPDPRWSPSQDNFYSITARRMDAYLRTQPTLTSLFAAANSGLHAWSTMAQQGLSKNSFTVGGTQATKSSIIKSNENYRESNVLNTSFNTLTNLYGGTSSCGPTFDHRIKPDFVAPGNQVWSMRATNYSNPYNNIALSAKTGTSMATPTLAGHLGIIQQMLSEGRINSGVPLDSNKIAKEQITSSLLKAFTMNSAQLLKHRASNTGHYPMPMRIQSFELPPLKVNNIRYEHAQIGSRLPVGELEHGEVLYVYAVPSVDKYIKTTNRYYRLIANVGCETMKSRITVTMGTKTDGPTGDGYQQVFIYEDEYEQDRYSLEWSAKAGEVMFFKFEFNIPATCTDDDEKYIEFLITEFTHDTYDKSQRFHDVDCYDTFEEFSFNSFPSFLSITGAFRCPPVPTCGSQFAGPIVYGNRFYHQESSICGSAQHNGNLNTTYADITDPKLLTWILQTQARETFGAQLGGVNPQASAINYVPGSHIVPTYQNGIRPVYFDGAAREEMVRLELSGDDFAQRVGASDKNDENDENNNLIVTDETTADLLNLRQLPPTANFASGFGLPKLSTILPLTQFIKKEQTNLSDDLYVQRYGTILADGLPLYNLKDGATDTHCFYISSKPLYNQYQYNYINRTTTEELTSETWNSGSDSLRVSLAYIDIPSSTAIYNGRTLINDLNLHLFTPDGTEYRGNQRADHNNNAERIDLLQGTFTPGMYCTTVHGVNIPVGNQTFALVAHGRGIQQCLPNPLPMNTKTKVKPTLSGVWTQSKVTCGKLNEKLTFENDMDNDGHYMNGDDKYNTNINNNGNDIILDEEYQIDNKYMFRNEYGNDLTQIYTQLSTEPETTPFHTIKQFQIKQGGNCFTIYDTIYKEYTNTTYLFQQQRISSSLHEQRKNWNDDSYYGTASTPSNSTFALSGHIDEKGKLTAELYKHLINPKYDYTQPLEAQIDENEPNINSVMMQDNIDLVVNGSFDIKTMKSLELTLIGTQRKCMYKYTRDVQFDDVIGRKF